MDGPKLKPQMPSAHRAARRTDSGKREPSLHDVLPRPDPAHERDLFLGPSEPPLSERRADGREILRPRAGTHADGQPAAGDDVQGGELLGLEDGAVHG
jgi:hypothetical protein